MGGGGSQSSLDVFFFFVISAKKNVQVHYSQLCHENYHGIVLTID